MTSQWTTKQVLDLAPDASAASAGRGLARPGKWMITGVSPAALWGELQGSGKDPYRVRVDLNELAFKCSCPSRKFPCKHALALLLILAEHPKEVPAGEPPDWVAEWLASRSTRKEAQATRVAEKREVDPAARAKRAAQRQARVEDGIEELLVWLEDLVRQGLGPAQMQPGSYWAAMAARLIDTQASGLARHVRRLGELAASGEGWQGRLMAGAGRLYLLCEAYRRLGSLPDEVQADVRTTIGWNITKEELSTLPRTGDTWFVLAQRVDREEQLRVQRTWLLGLASGRPALILQFAAGTQAFEQAFRLGSQFAAELVYYPGAVPLRAAFAGERGDPVKRPRPAPAAPALSDALRHYTAALARQPWLEVWPMRVGGVKLRRDDTPDGLVLCDADGRRLPLVPRFNGSWHLAALAGGDAIEVFGEWDGEAFRPLTAFADGGVFALGQSDTTTTLERVA
jgi:hypothetical protein